MFLSSFIYRHTDASHFWLNEGWTTYIERVLQQLLHGRSPARRGFSYLIGRKALQRSLEEFAEAAEKTKEEEKKKILRYQRLVIDFEKGEDPDDAYSRVPYEKGSNLLLYLGGCFLAVWLVLGLLYLIIQHSRLFFRTTVRRTWCFLTLYPGLCWYIYGQKYRHNDLERTPLWILV